MSDTPRWSLTFNDKQYTFDPYRDLTLSTMRQIKSWYPDIGRFLRFLGAFGEGDPDAIACALWVVRRKAGEPNVPEPNMMTDVGVGDLMATLDVVENERDPTPAAEPTTDSTKTSTPSETATSGSSGTSATTARPTSTTSASSTS